MTMGAAVRLTSELDSPLADEAVRGIVAASAQAIGERTGIEVRVREVDDRAIELEVAAGTLEATALAAELRRTTDEWHREKYGCPLWSQA